MNKNKKFRKGTKVQTNKLFAKEYRKFLDMDFQLGTSLEKGQPVFFDEYHGLKTAQQMLMRAMSDKFPLVGKITGKGMDNSYRIEFKNIFGTDTFYIDPKHIEKFKK